MASQKSILKVRGTLDDLTFFNLQGKHFVRRKTSLDGQRLKNDPAFRRTRENMQEFGTITGQARLIRAAFHQLLNHTKESYLQGRLVKTLYAVKRMDTVSERGMRTPAQGLESAEGRQILEGFTFNRQVGLSQIMAVAPVVDLATGTVQVNGFNPAHMLSAPASATHFQFHMAWAKVNFFTGTSETVYASTAAEPIDQVQRDIEITPANQPDGDGRDLVAFQVVFLQEVNGELYPLSDNSFQTGAIVRVA